MSSPPIDDLIPDLSAGREAAFVALYDALAGPLHRTAWTLTGSAAEAEDLVQETMVALVRARTSLTGVRNLRAYLFATLRHAAAARAERRATERRALARVPARETGPEPPRSAQAAIDSDRLARAVAALPSEQREVLALKLDGGLTFAEVGSTLGISPNTAASRYQYALNQLRELLPEGE